MGLSKQDIGRIGENAVCNYLQQNGLQILERNFRLRMGEIDIIAIKRNTVCFVEVKTRSNANYGHPLESIVTAKKEKIRKTAQYWLLKHPQYDDIMFLAAAVQMGKNGDILNIDLVEDNF